jgi:hypothetical protein
MKRQRVNTADSSSPSSMYNPVTAVVAATTNTLAAIGSVAGIWQFTTFPPTTTHTRDDSPGRKIQGGDQQNEILTQQIAISRPMPQAPQYLSPRERTRMVASIQEGRPSCEGMLVDTRPSSTSPAPTVRPLLAKRARTSSPRAHNVCAVFDRLAQEKEALEKLLDYFSLDEVLPGSGDLDFHMGPIFSDDNCPVDRRWSPEGGSPPLPPNVDVSPTASPRQHSPGPRDGVQALFESVYSSEGQHNELFRREIQNLVQVRCSISPRVSWDPPTHPTPQTHSNHPTRPHPPPSPPTAHPPTIGGFYQYQAK